MTEHERKARKRRTLSRKERSEIADGLRLAVHHGGNGMTMQEMLALADEIERAHIIIEVSK